jgi:hypothetical protein
MIIYDQNADRVRPVHHASTVFLHLSFGIELWKTQVQMQGLQEPSSTSRSADRQIAKARGRK